MERVICACSKASDHTFYKLAHCPIPSLQLIAEKSKPNSANCKNDNVLDVWMSARNTLEVYDIMLLGDSCSVDRIMGLSGKTCISQVEGATNPDSWETCPQRRDVDPRKRSVPYPAPLFFLSLARFPCQRTPCLAFFSYRRQTALIMP